MTDTDSDFVKQLLQRRAENDRELAEAQSLHATRRNAIDLLLTREGYVFECQEEGEVATEEESTSKKFETWLFADKTTPPTVLPVLRDIRADATCDVWSQRMRDAVAYQMNESKPGRIHVSSAGLDSLVTELGSSAAARAFFVAACRAGGDRVKATLDAATEDPDSATTRDFVRQALAHSDGPMRMVDVVDAVKQMGSTASSDTVRSVLQKMLHGGEARRPERGKYELVASPCKDLLSEALEDSLWDFNTHTVEVDAG